MTTDYLIMNTNIDQEKVQTFITWTTTKIQEGSSGFYIAFSTSGGNVSAGILMANYIQALPVPVTMHNVSSVASIGIPIYSAATERFSNPLSTFVFHGSGMTTADRLDEERLKNMLDSVKGQNDLIAKSIAETGGLDYQECRKLLSGEVSRSAKWAVENGICSKLIDFKIPEGTQLMNLF
ncbi:ATP-dependent Clp protease proteolytic subunit [Oceaniovalibus sp. ACAM 378]|uniref:ATP-dependent Clp protease proteolytic subunit n=1 Tax=Oceaniovalibus sp. ACAM 378 TaxID=2599923 RepID=UPI0011D6EFA4|nr:ATP-dependent Clp protease proteolytic subunit [Oceaniovalibus sp. ACAM 378]TYB83972.1 hypothetical protein FQ320_23420 [Oceaniovalibus sp. ACAM 378]